MIKQLIARFYMLRGQRLLNRGRPAKALPLFKTAESLAALEEYQFNTGLALLNLCRYQEAYDIFGRLYSAVKDNIVLSVSFAQAALLLYKWDEALGIYQFLYDNVHKNQIFSYMKDVLADVIKRDNYRAALDLQFKANMHMETGEDEKALKVLQQALKHMPEDAVLLNNIGALMLKMGHEPQAALVYFAKAIQVAPDEDKYKKNYRKVWRKVKRK